MFLVKEGDTVFFDALFEYSKLKVGTFLTNKRGRDGLEKRNSNRWQ